MGPYYDYLKKPDLRLPRTRGDGPYWHVRACQVSGVAPHTRGWALRQARRLRRQAGCPAHAGMGPTSSTRGQMIKRLPRTRGDGPLGQSSDPESVTVAPHTRGWAARRHCKLCQKRGCPAHAGMGPKRTAGDCTRPGLPRTRGDGPIEMARQIDFSAVAPHTRGWALHRVAFALESGGCPAHAGMGPSVIFRPFQNSWLPRTRGDGPQ